MQVAAKYAYNSLIVLLWVHFTSFKCANQASSPYCILQLFALLTCPTIICVSISYLFLSPSHFITHFHLFECANGTEICYLIIGLRGTGMNKHQSAGAGSGK